VTTRVALLLAAGPAVLAGALVMRAAGVDRVDIAQHVGVALVFATLAALTPTWRPRDEGPPRWWPSALLAACLFLPLTDSQDWGPRRWLYFGGLGLYVAPVVLPVLLLGVGRLPAVSLLSAGLALLLQPDAAQLTALAVASIPVLVASTHRPVAKLLIALSLLVAVYVGWTLPDPLAPVDHVEGLLRLAASFGALALGGAVLAAVIPSLTMWRLSFRLRSAGLLAVGLYYIVLIGLAPLEVTPVPLLGFGAGPIVGYALMAWAARRSA